MHANRHGHAWILAGYNQDPGRVQGAKATLVVLQALCQECCCMQRTCMLDIQHACNRHASTTCNVHIAGKVYVACNMLGVHHGSPVTQRNTMVAQTCRQAESHCKWLSKLLGEYPWGHWPAVGAGWGHNGCTQNITSVRAAGGCGHHKPAGGHTLLTRSCSGPWCNWTQMVILLVKYHILSSRMPTTYGRERRFITLVYSTVFMNLQ